MGGFNNVLKVDQTDVEVLKALDVDTASQKLRSAIPVESKSDNLLSCFCFNFISLFKVSKETNTFLSINGENMITLLYTFPFSGPAEPGGQLPPPPDFAKIRCETCFI